MSKTIHYFGDSHTAGIGDTGAPRKGIYFHIPYSTYLTEMLGIESKNYARGGKPFMLNVRDLCTNLHTFNEGDIVIFQTQFLCNSLLKYPKEDFIVSSGKFDKNQIYTNPKLGITRDDSITLLKWGTKFEERRSMYDLESVIGILTYLRTKGVHTWLMYWAPGFDVKLPINDLVLKFHGGVTHYPVEVKNIPTIEKVTDGEWKDGHTTNEFNKDIARQIFNQING